MTEWTWYGDSPPGVRRGAHEGWMHVHPDGTRWVHVDPTCPAASEPMPPLVIPSAIGDFRIEIGRAFGISGD